MAAVAAAAPACLLSLHTTPLQFYPKSSSRKQPLSTGRWFSSQPAIVAAISDISQPTTGVKLPIREIPGDYGPPLVGPWKDRQDYFYDQGRELFFTSRMQKYKSTVFKTNMPPGPFISSNSNVVVLLDGKSFPTLFDTDKVEKKDLFTGTYMPSTDLTGGYRTLSYLDPSEPSHAKLKKLIFFLLSYRRDHVIPEFQNAYIELFDSLEKELADKGKAGFGDLNDQAAFNFLTQSFFGADPRRTELGSEGPKLIDIWILFQLHPLLTLGLPRFIEDPILHTFPLPPFLVKNSYQKLNNFFYNISGPVLDEAETLGISRDEACHNILFTTCFNSYGGFKRFFPSLMNFVGRSGIKLQTELAKEVRSVLKSNGGKLTVAATESMPLLKSVVYETLRIEPPVALQYGKAKRDFVIESHDAAFQIKAGEMLFGFQPFATKDPKIFDRADDFVPDRFVGEGEKLLKYVLWSNGPETETPAVANKQCAGKDFVVLASRLFLVELFRRYDLFETVAGSSALGISITVTSLKRASF